MAAQLLDYSDFSEEQYDYLRLDVGTHWMEFRPDVTHPFVRSRTDCPFCRWVSMVNVFHCSIDGPPDADSSLESTGVWECPECGWWQYEHESRHDIPGYEMPPELPYGAYGIASGPEEIDIPVKVHRAIAKTFDIAARALPIDLCIAELNRNKARLYELHPTKLEEVAQHVFSSLFDCEVRHVGRTGDGGIDLVIVESDHPVLVQVKRRANPAATESVSIVREFVGAMYLKGAMDGIVLTTARRFAPAAHAEIATALKQRRFRTFKLIDYGEFCAMLDVVRRPSHRPWETLIKPA